MTTLIITNSDIFWYNVFYIFLCIGIVISFFLRNTPLGFLWHLFRLLITGMLISFGIDFIKKGAKDWWKS
jgi:hypothetical protein